MLSFNFMIILKVLRNNNSAATELHILPTKTAITNYKVAQLKNIFSDITGKYFN